MSENAIQSPTGGPSGVPEQGVKDEDFGEYAQGADRADSALPSRETAPSERLIR